MEQENDIKRLGDLAFLKNFFPDQAEQIGAWIPLLKTWNGLVGENIGCHSCARQINNHILLVDVDHPAWMNQFLFYKEEILERIQRTVPQLEIRAIRLRLVTDLSKPPVEPQVPESNPAKKNTDTPKDLQESLARFKALLED